MQVLVSDANILIDIEIGGLTIPMFSLNYQFITPDVLYFEELEEQHSHLIEMGLIIKEMNSELVLKVENLTKKYKGPSRNDIFSLVLASDKKCTLLSGDKALKNAAIKESVDCKGTVWILKELLSKKKITPQIARIAIEKMKENQSRLPWDEVEKIMSSFE